MSTDPETLAVYQSRAQDYASRFSGTEPDKALGAFIAAIPKGGHVLDLGCGPGHAARAMMKAELTVDALDATQAMVDLALAQGVGARLGTFDDLTGSAQYHGIWANFSLLHAPRAALPRHLSAIRKALKPGGYFHIGMKLGDGEQRDALGRQYTFVTRDELVTLLAEVGLTVVTENSFVEKGLAGTADPGITLLTQVADA